MKGGPAQGLAGAAEAGAELAACADGAQSSQSRVAASVADASGVTSSMTGANKVPRASETAMAKPWRSEPVRRMNVSLA